MRWLCGGVSASLVAPQAVLSVPAPAPAYIENHRGMDGTPCFLLFILCGVCCVMWRPLQRTIVPVRQPPFFCYPEIVTDRSTAVALRYVCVAVASQGVKGAFVELPRFFCVPVTLSGGRVSYVALCTRACGWLVSGRALLHAAALSSLDRDKPCLCALCSCPTPKI